MYVNARYSTDTIRHACMHHLVHACIPVCLAMGPKWKPHLLLNWTSWWQNTIDYNNILVVLEGVQEGYQFHSPTCIPVLQKVLIDPDSAPFKTDFRISGMVS